MESPSLIEQGVELMLFGMGTVFVFLALLVVSVSLMSRLLTRYFPAPEPVPMRPRQRPAGSAAPARDDAVVAAISAAIHRHRNRRR